MITFKQQSSSYVPRSYQEVGISLGVSQASAAMLMAPGLGKTSIAYAIFSILQNAGFVKKMLVICPLKPAYNVWPSQKDKYTEFKHLRVCVLHGKNKEELLKSDDYDIYVVNPEGLDWLFGPVVKHAPSPSRFKLVREKFQMLWVDECFVAGTLVLTPTGKKPIESLTVGDTVLTSAGERVVRHTGKRKAQSMLNLRLANGELLQCTPEHPFFTDVGWVCAGDLHGRTILDRDTLSSLRGTVLGKEESSGSSLRERTDPESLFQVLRYEEDAFYESSCGGTSTGRWSGKVEQKSSMARQASQRGDKGQAERAGAEAEGPVLRGSAWERNGNDGSGEDSHPTTAGWLCMELPSAVGEKARGLSYKLQARLRKPGDYDWNRSGRSIPSIENRARREEDYQVGGVRVESIEVIESDNLPNVYNLSVAGTPNYFVGRSEVLVHNCHKFKDTSTNRFKLMRNIVPAFKRRYIGTGTFNPEGLEDLFGQVYLLDEGVSLGRYITHYRGKYFHQKPYDKYTYYPNHGAAEEIAAKIAPYSLVAGRDLVPDLPALMFDDRLIDLPPAARKAYDQAELDLLVKLEAGDIVAANAAVASSKCRQIANGFVYGNEGQVTRLHTEKLEDLKALIEEMAGQPLVVTYEFIEDHDILISELKVPSISTGNAKKDNETIERFRRGAYPVVIGSTASISLGIDGLQDICGHLYMYGVTWRVTDYIQVIDRIRRSGNKHSNVIIHRCLARDTVDERVVAKLDVRETDMIDFMAILKGLRSGGVNKTHVIIASLAK